MTKFFSFDEAWNQSLEYFNGAEYTTSVFLSKYALRDNDLNILEPTPDYMHDRLATEFARIDAEKYGQNYDERFKVYRDAIDKFARIVPQGSPMAAIGNKYQLMSASNCVVVESPEDSIEGIFTTALDLAQLMKRRCGVGLDISSLRPDGTNVNNAARTTSGAWSFADLYSYVTRMIGQSGRRGALMVTIDVHHPDVMKFITMKHDKTKVTGANISVRLSNEFLKAVETDSLYEQRWPCEGEPKIKKMVSAREVWNEIIESATTTAEPGLIMWNTMLANLPAHCYPQYKTISTNPCSEIALSAYDSCRLVSINLTGYVRNAFEPNVSFDYSAFEDDIRIAMQMVDNIVDIELELINKIKGVCKEGRETDLWNKLYKAGEEGRRTGLGTHALGDTLAQLRIRYDSEDALVIIDKIYSTFRDAAYGASVDLAKERGAFPAFNWELEKNCEFIQRLPNSIKKQMAKTGRRNVAILTQAPTGSTSAISKVGEFNRFYTSSGIEPVHSNYSTRRKKINANDEHVRVDFVDVVGDKWQEYKIYHPNVLNYREKFGNDSDDELPDFFVTADKIDGDMRIKLQGLAQAYIDHSISSTINLPKGTKSDIVGRLYMNAWKHGLKGVTVYVEGSRDGVILSENEAESDDRIVPERQMTLKSETHKIKIDTGDSELKNAYITVSFFPDTTDPYEVFINAPVASNMKDIQILEVASRLASLALRHGVPVEFVSKQLEKVDGQYLYSIPVSIAKALRSYIKTENKKAVQNETGPEALLPAKQPTKLIAKINNISSEQEKRHNVPRKIACKNPESCPSEKIYEEGCVRCTECPWSGCS